MAPRACHDAGVAKRSYGTGSLYVERDSRGRESWYGRWRSPGGGKANRKLGLKRQRGNSEGLTRVQAERELRRRIDENASLVARGQRRGIAAAGAAYVDHLENVMERKRTTIQDYRGYLRRHLEPFFGDRPLDRVDERQVSAYLRVKRDGGLSTKTVQNHLNFLHGLFRFAVRHGWAERNPVAMVERPRKTRRSNRRLRFLQPVELDAVIQAGRGGRPRSGRATALPDRGHDRPAPGRADRTGVAGHRLDGTPGAGR